MVWVALQWTQTPTQPGRIQGQVPGVLGRGWEALLELGWGGSLVPTSGLDLAVLVHLPSILLLRGSEVPLSGGGGRGQAPVILVLVWTSPWSSQTWPGVCWWEVVCWTQGSGG